MPLPLIIKAAAIGGAAYAASRWLAGQRRQRLQSASPYAVASSPPADTEHDSTLRDSHSAGDNVSGLGASAGPSS
jgi:hypothetical protein